MTDSGFNTPSKALVIFQFSFMYISFSNISSPCIVMVFFSGSHTRLCASWEKGWIFLLWVVSLSLFLLHQWAWIFAMCWWRVCFGEFSTGHGEVHKKVGAPCYRYVVGLAAFSPPRKQITKRDPIFLWIGIALYHQDLWCSKTFKKCSKTHTTKIWIYIF